MKLRNDNHFCGIENPVEHLLGLKGNPRVSSNLGGETYCKISQSVTYLEDDPPINKCIHIFCLL